MELDEEFKQQYPGTATLIEAMEESVKEVFELGMILVIVSTVRKQTLKDAGVALGKIKSKIPNSALRLEMNNFERHLLDGELPE